MSWIDINTEKPPLGKPVLLIYGIYFGGDKSKPIKVKREPIIGILNSDGLYYAMNTVYHEEETHQEITDTVLFWQNLPMFN